MVVGSAETDVAVMPHPIGRCCSCTVHWPSRSPTEAPPLPGSPLQHDTEAVRCSVAHIHGPQLTAPSPPSLHPLHHHFIACRSTGEVRATRQRLLLSQACLRDGQSGRATACARRSRAGCINQALHPPAEVFRACLLEVHRRRSPRQRCQEAQGQALRQEGQESSVTTAGDHRPLPYIAGCRVGHPGCSQHSCLRCQAAAAASLGCESPPACPRIPRPLPPPHLRPPRGVAWRSTPSCCLTPPSSTAS